MANRQPWDILTGENPRQFAAFTLYRDLGPERTFEMVRRETGYGQGSFTRMYKKWNWKERALAWDLYLDRQRQGLVKNASHNMSQRQAGLGRRMQTLAEKRIAQIEQSDELINSLSVTDAVRLASEGVRIERLAEGETTDNSGQPIVFNIAVVGDKGEIIQDKFIPKWAPKIIEGNTDNGNQIQEATPSPAANRD